MTDHNWQPTQTHLLITLEGNDQGRQLLEEIRRTGARVRWVAVDPEAQYPHERCFADEDIWENIETELQDWADQNQRLTWNHGAPPDWNREERRRFIQFIVEKLGHLGPNGADLGEALIRLDLVEPIA